MNEIYGMNDYEMGYNVAIDEIEVADPTLFCMIVDCSISMRSYENVMPVCIDTVKDSIIESKNEDEFLVCLNYFDDKVKLGGYQKIHDVSNAYQTGGCTALYDAIVEVQAALVNDNSTGYYDQLRQSGITPKVIFAILSDGADTASKKTPSEARKAVEYLNKKEMITAYIAFGEEAIGIGEDLKFQNVMNVKDTTKENLRSIFRILSKSAISASKSNGAVLAGDFFQV